LLLEGGIIRLVSTGLLMNITAKLNEKLSKYTSPKVNWLAKKPWLLQLLGTTSSLVTLGISLALFVPLLMSSDTVFKSGFIVALGFIFVPIPSTAVFLLCEKQKTPKREKVIEKYTNCILKNFAESEYYDVKIGLLKILNNEPYTPVYFLDEMVRLKEIADQQIQREKDKELVAVNDTSTLTVLIEQMEQDEAANQTAKNDIREQKLKSVFKL